MTMSIFGYIGLVGAVAALAFGAFKLNRIASYIILFIVAAWLMYTVSTNSGVIFALSAIFIAILFAIYAALYWLGGKLSRQEA